MTFYAINGGTVHEFIYRRISESEWCEKKVKKRICKTHKRHAQNPTCWYYST